MGLKKDVLYIGTADGKSYEFTPNYDFWLAGLKEALEGQGATLVQSSDERWSVQGNSPATWANAIYMKTSVVIPTGLQLRTRR